MTSKDIAVLTLIFNDLYGKVAALDTEVKAIPTSTPGLTASEVQSLIDTTIANEPTLDATQIPTPSPAPAPTA